MCARAPGFDWKVSAQYFSLSPGELPRACRPPAKAAASCQPPLNVRYAYLNHEKDGAFIKPSGSGRAGEDVPCAIVGQQIRIRERASRTGICILRRR